MSVKKFFKAAMLGLHIAIFVLLLALCRYHGLFSNIAESGLYKVLRSLLGNGLAGYCLLVAGGLLLFYRVIRRSSLFPHEKYLAVTVLLSLFVLFFPAEKANSDFLITIQSFAISLLSGVVVAFYSELKSAAINERKELLKEIKLFQEQVRKYGRKNRQ